MRFTQSAQGRNQAQQLEDDKPESKAPPIAGRLIRLKEIKQLTGLSASTIYMHVSEDLFPKAVRLGPRSVAWRVWITLVAVEPSFNAVTATFNGHRH